jgi:hypothetical protein
MLKTRERLPLMLLFVTLLLVVALAAAGCQEAETDDEATTETTATTEPAPDGETTTTVEGEDGDANGEDGQAEESPAPVSEQFRMCTDCHSDFNRFLTRPGQNVLTDNFSHGVHINLGIRCEDCHVVPTHQPDRIVVPPMQKCFTPCHSQEEDAQAPGACGACHPADFPLVPANHNQAGWLPPAEVQLVKTVQGTHSDMALQDQAYCDMCHARQFCLDCHQTPMPHGGDWQAAHPQQVRDQGGQGCERCHPQEYLCNDCHHTGYEPTEVGWELQHPPIVRGGGAEGCFSCHNPLVCAHCHITGEFSPDAAPTGG